MISESVMKYLRLAEGYDPDDKSHDAELQKLSPEAAFDRVILMVGWRLWFWDSGKILKWAESCGVTMGCDSKDAEIAELTRRLKLAEENLEMARAEANEAHRQNNKVFRQARAAIRTSDLAELAAYIAAEERKVEI